jgi:hypothetical protein
VKVEGGQVEGGMGGHIGVWVGRHARGQLGDRVAKVRGLRQGRVSEALVFLGLPLPAALTNVMFVRGI